MSDAETMIVDRVQTPKQVLVEFLVEVNTNPWECVYVVGNVPVLGDWNPKDALQLNVKPGGSGKQWVGHIDVISSPELELQYRYFVCQYLDAQKDSTSGKELVVVRWETGVAPRTLMPAIECQYDRCSKKEPDTFGYYSGRSNEDDGWLINQQELRLRMHGEALQFWKQRHQQRVYRIKCTPIDLRFRDVYKYSEGRHDSCQQHGDNASSGSMPPSRRRPPSHGWRALTLFSAGSVDDDEDSRDAVATPALPSYTPTELALLSDRDPSFKQQDEYGRVYENNSSYFVFRTQTVARDFLAFLFDFYVDPADQILSNGTANESSSSHTTTASGGSSSNTSTATSDSDRKPERVGFCYFMPNNFKETYGDVTIPITSLRHQPIGKITVDFLKIRPIVPQVPRLSMKVSYSRHWKKRTTLDVGHRGMGKSYTKFAVVRENTLSSLQYATRHGADYVEFDVQLSKDKIPIVYHDFHVCLEVLRKLGTSVNVDSLDPRESLWELHELSIKELKLNQLQLLKLSHRNQKSDKVVTPPVSPSPSKTANGPIDHLSTPPVSNGNEVSVSPKCDVTDHDDEEPENQAFPTLEQVLQQLDPMCGCNVEIKYPMLQEDGEWECDNFWERNEYIDRILADVLNHAGDRRIVFSSFDPDICTMIKLKQNMYPVLFLCLGNTTRYTPFFDKRSTTSKMGVRFAISSRILGVNFHSEDLLRDAEPFHLANDTGLVSFVWGDDLDNKETIKHFKQLGVDGVIYDRINESKKNIFVAEKDFKGRLFNTASNNVSPVQSRQTSVDDMVLLKQSPTHTTGNVHL